MKVLRCFIKENKIFSILFFLALLGISFVTFYFVMKEPLYYSERIGKWWETISCLFTATFTCYYWFISEEGTDILDDLEDYQKKQKLKTILKIISSVVLLGVIAFINIQTSGIESHHIGLILMILTFLIFVVIDALIIKNYEKKLTNLVTNGASTDDINRINSKLVSLKNLLNSSDVPGLIAFIILLAYYVVTYFSNIKMELFFSGAIAFQMLFTSFIWAKTDVK